MPIESPPTTNRVNNDAEQRVPLIAISGVDDKPIASNIPFADDEIEVDVGADVDVDADETNSIDMPCHDTSRERRSQSPFQREFRNSSSSLRKSSFDEDSSSSDIDSHMETISRNLRRNSISLPSGINALDLEALRLKHQMVEQDPLTEEEKSSGNSRTESVADHLGDSTSESIDKSVSDIPTQPSIHFVNENKKNDDDDDDSDLEFKPKHRDRFRNRRRASIAPLPALRLNSKEMLASDFDTHSVASNQASITSVNSLASLLREKMQIIRKKKRETKDYKIKVFVLMLFFIIIFLIGYAYVAYHQKILTHSYFEKIKFNPKDRNLYILNQDEKTVLKGQLGTTLDMYNNPFHCLDDNLRNDGSLCIEWNGVARLYMSFENMGVFRCYTLEWQALSDGVFPTDCYELTLDNGFWFGGGITKGFDWSLSSTDFSYAPYVSGDAKIHQFGNGVKRYFINSIGVAMKVDDQTPLQIATNRTENKFCLRAMNNDFTFVNRLTPFPELKYKICTTEDMRSLHMLMTQKSLWDGMTENDIKVLNTLIEEPVWKAPFYSEIESINETTLYNYSEEIIAMGFMRLGHILVNEFWQVNIGDFTVDQDRFPTLKDTIDVLHRRGFKIIFTIQPFISTESPNFKEAVEKKLLIYERYSDRSIPALTRYKSSSSAGVLDITNNASIPWLIEKLNALKTNYKVDSFYLDLGTGYNLPHYYQCRQTLNNPDMYAKLFTESLEEVGIIGVSTASVAPRPPIFLSLPPTNSSWNGLGEVIPAVVNYGVSGYPFVLPGAIGGDYQINREPKKMISFYSLGQPDLPDPELYLRWLQVLIFMPTMQFGHLPTEYKSDYITDAVKELMNIRQKTVIPLLKKYLGESMNEGLPLVRPLWMLDPRDPACLIVSDEFSVGEELIVAPILERHSQEREVYLPQGVWKDGIDGSLRKGSRWIHSYKVPKEKVAFFIKMPDNTRF